MGMEKLLSNGVRYDTVPNSYILPTERRPVISANTCKEVPVIHLNRQNQLDISQQIINAGKEFGFFQVVDHGVREEVFNDMQDVAEEFFDLPSKDKALFYSEDPNKSIRLYTGQGYNTEETHYWRDCLRLICYSQDEFAHLYPDKPVGFRNTVLKYVEEVKKLAARILKMISIGLKLEDDYFEGDFSNGQTNMNINHYPPCPDPSLTLGLPKHCDPNLITFLLQGNASGLQVMHDGEWVRIEPVANAFVVNFGHVLEIISNGLLKSVEHQAVTNMSSSRTSIATFIMPTTDCVVCPALSFTDPVYRSLLYSEFFGIYLANKGDRTKTMNAVEIQA